MAKRVSTPGIKANRHYTYRHAAEKLGLSEQTVRAMRQQGLAVMTDAKPHLILGQDLIVFIEHRQKPRLQMPPDQFRCFKCRRRSRPLDGIAFYISQTATSGRLEAFCGLCEGPCSRFVSARDLPEIAQFLEVVRNDAEHA